jgi:hypothetical protein
MTWRLSRVLSPALPRRYDNMLLTADALYGLPLDRGQSKAGFLENSVDPVFKKPLKRAL